MIKKSLLTLEAKFWWLLIRYKLIPTTLKKTLTWEREALIACLMADYDANFATILSHELHDRPFVKLTNLTFPCMNQSLCDDDRVSKLPDIDEREPTTMQIRTMQGIVLLGTSR